MLTLLSSKVLRELEKEDSEITKLRDVETTTPITSFADLSSAASETPSVKANSWWQSKDLSRKEEANSSNGSMEIRVKDPSKTEK